MSDPLSEEIWREHERWLAGRRERELRKWRAREVWGSEEWERARVLADERWDGQDFYLYAALRALEEVQWERIERRMSK